MTSKQFIATLATAGTLLTGGVVNNVQLEAQDQAINPYIENVDTLETRVKANKVLVHKDKPKITLEKWNNKDSLGVSYSKTKSKGKSVRKELTKITEYQVSNKESVVMEPTEDGEGFNIDILLNSKPSSNVFTYTFENWQDKDFFYQPELTPQEIANGVSRPDNVVGSYAVYSKVNKDHITGQTNYQTGKLFHIYRPLISDANGSTTWAVLNIVDGAMTVTVPQEFLDTAVYPVLVDPTFGYTSVGASYESLMFGTNNYIRGYKAQSGVLGTGDNIRAYIIENNDSSARVIKYAIYLDDGSGPNAILTNSQTAEVSCEAGTINDWKIANFVSSPTIAASTNYWVAGWGTDANSTKGVRIALDTTGSNSGFSLTSDYGASWPTPLTTEILNNWKYSIYVTYTESGGVTPSPDRINIQSGAVKVMSGKVIR